MLLFLAGDELLTAVDVVGRPREGPVAHDVDGQGGDVGWSHDAPNGQRDAELIPPLVEIVSKESR